MSAFWQRYEERCRKRLAARQQGRGTPCGGGCGASIVGQSRFCPACKIRRQQESNRRMRGRRQRELEGRP